MPLIFDKNLSLSRPHTFQTGAGLEKQIVTLADQSFGPTSVQREAPLAARTLEDVLTLSRRG